MRCLLGAILMMAAPCALAQTADRDAQVEQFWSRDAKLFETSGITKPMFRQFFYWTEQQYLLGICAPNFAESDVLFWRNWWKDTPIEKSDFGRSLLLGANDAYNSGVADRLKGEAPSRAVCIRSINGWLADMKKVVASGR